MIVSSFVYVGFWRAPLSIEGPNNILVLRFGEHNRIQIIIQEGYLRPAIPRPGRRLLFKSAL